MTRIRSFPAFLVALALLAPPRSAQAQLGGLGKKIKEKITGPEKKAPEQPPVPGLTFDEELIELTAPNIDRFVGVMRTELALQKEFKAELAKYPTPEEFRACQTQVAMSEEAQKLLQLMDLPDNAPDEAKLRGAQKYQTEMLALLKRKCPLDPDDWSSSRKHARLQEIQTKALETGGATAPPPGNWGFDGAPRLEGEASSPGPISASAYALFKERAVAFCMSTMAAPGTDFSVSPVKVPGTTGLFYVYTSEEARALQQKCSQLMELMGQLIPV